MSSFESDRFYEKAFPEPNELVVVKVLRLENNMGAYVSLLEYGKMEGLILPSELSKRRFRSINKLIRVGRQEVVMVVRVDEEKGYVDLSKKRVAPEDIGITEERFSKSKKVYLTTRQVASHLEMEVEKLNQIAIWPLYKKYGHAYEGLREAVEDAAKAFEGIDCPKDVIDALVADMKPRLTPVALKIRVRINVACTGEKGVLAVKEALLAGQARFADENEQKFDLKVQLVASPLYVLIASCLDKTEGVAKVQEALEIVKSNILASPGGMFQQQGEIIAFGADDERADMLSGSESGESDEDSDEDGSEEEEEGSEEEEEEEE